jgi:hypothetical protein
MYERHHFAAWRTTEDDEDHVDLPEDESGDGERLGEVAFGHSEELFDARCVDAKCRIGASPCA